MLEQSITRERDRKATSSSAAFAEVSRGAYAYVTILRPYLCATGPRAGWTMFTDSSKLAIINRHLEQDGKLPISRATYYRWKRDAKRAKLLQFTSRAKRATVRKRARGGRWMRVAPAQAVRVWASGRRLRRSVRETFGSPPAHETFGSPDPHRDHLPPERSERGGDRRRSAVADCPPAPENENPAIAELEGKLIAIAVTTDSEELYTKWEPLPKNRRMRHKAIERAMTVPDDDRRADPLGLAMRTIGMAERRSRASFRAFLADGMDPFWDVQKGDVVARCAAYAYDRQNPSIWDQLLELGHAWLWKHRIDPHPFYVTATCVSSERAVDQLLHAMRATMRARTA